MPTRDVILAGLTAIASEWHALAIAWHVAFGLAIAAVSAGWRPSQRLVGLVLPTPFVSVSLLAWQSGNPFNAIVFASLALMLLGIARTMPADAIRLSARPSFFAGALLLLFGWTYPHFVMTDRSVAYLYASPLGLIPCPTLAAVIGVSLSLGLSRSAAWGALLAFVGIAYGLIGVFRLDVTLDYGLLAGASVSAAISATVAVWRRSEAVSPGLPVPGSAVSSRS